MTTVHGEVAAGFEPVREAFAANFAERGEIGAAFSAYVDGHRVAHLWGGVADTRDGRPWDAGTLQVIFSGTKGLVALCALLLVDRGELDLDAPVTRYWPEYGAAGKQGTLVRHLLTHTAGVPGVRSRTLEPAELLDPVGMAALLAAEEPVWEPGAMLCYHPLTYGWLAGEVIRRIDGRDAGRMFAEEVAGPLGLDLWIGLPPEHERSVAQLELTETWGSNPLFDPNSPDPVTQATWHNPRGLWLGDGFEFWNAPATHAAVIPGAGAVGNVDAVARLYACLARGGELDGVRLLSEATLTEGRRRLVEGRHPTSGEPFAFATGFMVQQENRPLGPAAVTDAFGHDGAGGSCHGAWPGARAGFSYAMNAMRDDEAPGEGRDDALLAALADVLGVA